jgi:uncharacterized membrane protein
VADDTGGPSAGADGPVSAAGSTAPLAASIVIRSVILVLCLIRLGPKFSFALTDFRRTHHD